MSSSPGATSVITSNELNLSAHGVMQHTSNQQQQQQNHHLQHTQQHNEHSPLSPNRVVSAATSVVTTNTSVSASNGLPLIAASAMHRSPDSPQPELATMTNVNVLDLHTDNSKLYDKDAVFIYESPKVIMPPVVQQDDQQQHIIDARMVAQMNAHQQQQHHQQQQQQQHQQAVEQQPLAKIEFDENQIIRVVGPNGEQQQIISREIINGEHHILSRNEAGEHILTRIVSDPSKLMPNDNAVATAMFNQAQKLANEQHGVYQTSPLDASALQHHYDGDNVVKTEVDIYDDPKKAAANAAGQGQIIYATSADEDPTKQQQLHLPVPTKLDPEMFTGDKHIDLIYDGNKTVIYTTSDQKGIEIYSGGDLSGLVADGQVVVQGGLQYAPAGGAQGQPVYIVADGSLPPGVEGHLQR